MKESVTITFENEDKSKKAKINIVNKGYDMFDVSVEFIPEINNNTKDLYAVMAVKFLNHISS